MEGEQKRHLLQKNSFSLIYPSIRSIHVEGPVCCERVKAVLAKPGIIITVGDNNSSDQVLVYPELSPAPAVSASAAGLVESESVLC